MQTQTVCGLGEISTLRFSHSLRSQRTSGWCGVREGSSHLGWVDVLLMQRSKLHEFKWFALVPVFPKRQHSVLERENSSPWSFHLLKKPRTQQIKRRTLQKKFCYSRTWGGVALRLPIRKKPWTLGIVTLLSLCECVTDPWRSVDREAADWAVISSCALLHTAWEATYSWAEILLTNHHMYQKIRSGWDSAQ